MLFKLSKLHKRATESSTRFWFWTSDLGLFKPKTSEEDRGNRRPDLNFSKNFDEIEDKNMKNDSIKRIVGGRRGAQSTPKTSSSIPEPSSTIIYKVEAIIEQIARMKSTFNCGNITKNTRRVRAKCSPREWIWAILVKDQTRQGLEAMAWSFLRP